MVSDILIKFFHKAHFLPYINLSLPYLGVPVTEQQWMNATIVGITLYSELADF